MSDRKLDLAGFVDHSTAPIWWLAAHGRPAEAGAAFLCPHCGGGGVRIRAERGEVFVVSRAVGVETLPVDYGRLVPDDPMRRDFTGITIPMRCSAGHEWMLSIEQQGDGAVCFAVILSDAVYEIQDPHAKEVWG